MAKRKFEIISEMFDRVSTEVTSSPDKWRSFLNSACRNFKLRYDEQILVYAQKPEATAVLPIERWNRTFGRWVNRGAKGIAVFEMIGGDSQRLVHYFDISDTHASENSRPVPIWNMRSEYESEVIDTLENTFGNLNNKDDIEQAIISAADNAVEDNTPDYISDLIRTVDDSFLEGLGEDAVDVMYRQLVKNSVAYMMMARLGINADLHFDDDDFRDIVNFNTKATANAIGFATSDIAEMGLTEVSRTVIALSRQNRIIAENRDTEYTNDTPNESYLLPDVTLPEQPRVTLGHYAQMRKNYLLNHHKLIYFNYLTSGTLTAHLADVQEQAVTLEENIVKKMAQNEGVTEKLKAEDPMKWTRLMNNLRHSAQEIVKEQVIFV